MISTHKSPLYLLILMLVVFVGVMGFHALDNQNPGRNDSIKNLEAARNIAHGKGFTSSMIVQLAYPEEYPFPEIIRAPAVPFLAAALFKLFGVNLAIQVVLNGLIISLATLMLYYLLQRWLSPIWALIYALIFLGMGNYNITELLGYNFLITVNIILLVIAGQQFDHPDRLFRHAIALGLLGGVGYLLKPSYVLTGVPFAIYLIMVASGGGWKLDFLRKFKALILCGLMMCLVALPLWLRNLDQFGTLQYAPLLKMRLVERYKPPVDGGSYQAVSFNKSWDFATLDKMQEKHWIIKRELSLWGDEIQAIIKLSPALVLIILLTLPGLLRQPRTVNKHWLVLAAITSFESVFSAAYIVVAFHYLWPVFPGLLVLSAYGQSVIDNKHIRLVVFLLLAVACLNALYYLQGTLRGVFLGRGADRTPAWQNIVLSLPDEAVILTDDPHKLSWYGKRRAIICPVGPQSDVRQILEQYCPDYLFITQKKGRYPCVVPTGAKPMVIDTSDRNNENWELYRLPSLDEKKCNHG